MPPLPFNGRRAAVSLTYDDCMDCHLDLVAPALEARGFRGTFYTPVNATLMERMDEHMLPRFVAARGTKRDIDETIDPANFSPGNLGTPGGDGLSLDALKTLVDMAVARGHWIILTFHGVEIPAPPEKIFHNCGTVLLILRNSRMRV
ncbi:MAG: hypothetical protein JJU05_06320 [Verrucomicrobia bacterium]|nr:hypothetical protein [Verrucomicrobiota bacterium]MCH8525744.1 hypothetical protein [Kiritimatiellia bacterium]